MTGLELRLRVLEPVALTRGAGRRNSAASFDHVPGSSLRGAIAASYLARHPPDDRFERLFERDTRFLAALPAEQGVRSWATPASRRQCKYDPTHVRFDPTLAKRAIQSARDPSPPAVPTNCATCGAALVAPDHRWETAAGTPVAVELGASTRSAMHDGTAKEGALFAAAAIAPGTELLAMLRGPGAAEVADLTGLREGAALRFGRGKTTGGVVELTAAPRQLPAHDLSSVFDRWEAAVAVVLRSPAIVVDPWLRPSAELGVQVPGYELEARWVSGDVVLGWNAGQGLPKSPDQALAAGSTFLFRLVDDDAYGEVAPWQQLVDDGIGLRRAEGFGEVDICPPNLEVGHA